MCFKLIIGEAYTKINGPLFMSQPQLRCSYVLLSSSTHDTRSTERIMSPSLCDIEILALLIKAPGAPTLEWTIRSSFLTFIDKNQNKCSAVLEKSFIDLGAIHK